MKFTLRREKLTILFLLLISFYGLAQKKKGLNFMAENDSNFKLELEKYEQLVFVNIYADWCRSCQDMEVEVFTSQEVSNYFNKHFINVKWYENEPSTRQRLDSLNILSLPTYLFLHPQGEVVHRIEGYHSPKMLLLEAQYANNQKKKWLPLKVLMNRNEKGTASHQDLKALLNRLYPVSGAQPQLLDDYMRLLPKSLYRIEENLILIAQHIGGVDSHSFGLLRESLQYFFDLTKVQQKAILEGLNRSKMLSFKKAVATKDDALLGLLFQASYDTSYSKESAIEEQRQLGYEYAKLTRNFLYFSEIAYAEAPGVLHQDFEVLDKEKYEYLRSLPSEPVEEWSQFQGSSQNAAAVQLHDFAYGFLQMTSDHYHLQNALNWAEVALELNERPDYWLTYGRLLYKLERKREAKRVVRKSRKLIKKLGGDTKHWDFSLLSKP